MRCEGWRSVTSARRLYALHVGLASIGLGTVLTGAGVALSKVEPALPSAEVLLAACRGILPAERGLAALVLILVSLGLVVLVLAVRSIARQLRGQRGFLRRFSSLGAIEVDGNEVVLLQSGSPEAFCAGFLRPRIYLSTAALDRLSEAELLAVVAHEAHHQRNHDPLRLLLASGATDALFFLPALRRLGKRYKELAEIAADETAREAEGAPTLASALLTLGERNGRTPPVIGIAAERVDHLLGRPSGWQLPLSIFGSSLIVLTALTALVFAAAGWDASTGFSMASILAQACMIGMFAIPLGVGMRLFFLWRDSHHPSPAATTAIGMQ